MNFFNAHFMRCSGDALALHQRIFRSLCLLVITAYTGLLSFPANAADPFPSKPIQIVIPFAPGDTDNMIRPFADRMAEFLGQPVVLNFKPGAGGGIGAGAVNDSRTI